MTNQVREWTYFEVRHGGRIRFETLRREEATDFATGVYKNEGIVCEIYEIEREQQR
jgi:hypothetical protein